MWFLPVWTRQGHTQEKPPCENGTTQAMSGGLADTISSSYRNSGKKPSLVRSARTLARSCGGGAKRWGLLRVRFSPSPQGCRCLWRRVFPGFAPAEGRLRPETHAPRASLGKTPRNGMTAPPEDNGGSQRDAPTIWQGHLSLQGTPWRPRHLGGRQASISDLRRTSRRMGGQHRVVHAHHRTSCKSESFPYPEGHWACMLTLSP